MMSPDVLFSLAPLTACALTCWTPLAPTPAGTPSLCSVLASLRRLATPLQSAAVAMGEERDGEAVGGDADARDRMELAAAAVAAVNDSPARASGARAATVVLRARRAIRAPPRGGKEELAASPTSSRAPATTATSVSAACATSTPPFMLPNFAPCLPGGASLASLLRHRQPPSPPPATGGVAASTSSTRGCGLRMPADNGMDAASSLIATMTTTRATAATAWATCATA